MKQHHQKSSRCRWPGRHALRLRGRALSRKSSGFPEQMRIAPGLAFEKQAAKCVTMPREKALSPAIAWPQLTWRCLHRENHRSVIGLRSGCLSGDRFPDKNLDRRLRFKIRQVGGVAQPKITNPTLNPRPDGRRSKDERSGSPNSTSKGRHPVTRQSFIEHGQELHARVHGGHAIKRNSTSPPTATISTAGRFETGSRTKAQEIQIAPRFSGVCGFSS